MLHKKTIFGWTASVDLLLLGAWIGAFVAALIWPSLDWLHVTAFVLMCLVLGVTGMLIAFIVLYIAAIIFVPVIFRSHRDVRDWTRTIGLTGSAVFFSFYTYCHWRFLPPCNLLGDKISLVWGTSTTPESGSFLNTEIGRVVSSAVLVSVESLVVFMSTFIFIQVASFLMNVGNAWAKLMQRLASLFSDVFAWLETALKHKQDVAQASGSASGLAVIWSGIFVNAILLLIALFGKQSAGAISIAFLALVVTIVTLQRPESKNGRSAVSITVIGAALLTLMSVIELLIAPTPNGQNATSSTIPDGSRLVGVCVSSVLQDASYTLLLFLIVNGIFLKGWWTDERRRNAAVNARKVLVGTAGGYLFLKVTVIIGCLAVCDFTSGHRCSGTKPITGLDSSASVGIESIEDVTKKQLQGTEISGPAFFYMAWTGNVLSAKEFLYMTYRPIADRKLAHDDISGLEESFKADVDIYEPYYTSFYACMVLIQIFFGWHYGIQVLAYLLFAYCLAVFEFPRPQPNEPVQSQRRDGQHVELGFADRRRSYGAVARIKEASEAITALGFIGTLLGLSQAVFFLGDTDPVRTFLGESGISYRLTASLGMGFFTTFITMSLRLILNMRFSQLAGGSQHYRELQEEVMGG